MKNQFNLNFFLFLGLMCFSLALSTNSNAQVTVTVDQPLNFGTYVIRDFATRSRVTIRNNGTFTTNTNVYMIDNPTRGEYTLSAPSNPNTAYTITTPPTFTFSGGPGGNFTLDNISVRPNNLITDGAGQDNFRLSGRLRSDGGGVNYGDGTYSDAMTITFNF